MVRPSLALAAALPVLSLGGPPPATADPPPPGPGCAVDRPDDRCPDWRVEYDDTSIAPPRRSDQFVTGVVADDDRVVVAMKDVGLDPGDPYAATGSWLVLGHDAETGEQVWRAERRSRAYDSPHDVALSPDGATVFVTGAAYDAFPVAARDSRVVTVAYDAVTGTELWDAEWDGSAERSDVGKVLAVSPDGRRVFVGGLTTAGPGDLDYLVLAYDAATGRRVWTGRYAGPGGDDVLTDLGVSPDGGRVYTTGQSLSGREYDNDYLTVAFVAARGRPGGIDWVVRDDVAGLARSDRAGALAVASDGSVVVTGDSYVRRGDGGDGYDVATVAYDPDGRRQWLRRYAGPGSGLAFDGGRDVVVAGGTVVVTAQSAGATTDDALDAATVGYDVVTGEERWVHREDQPRSSELPMALAAEPGGQLAFLVSSARPVVSYTALDQLVVHAYDVGTGAEAWTARLAPDPGDATEAEAVAVSPAGRVVVAGLVTRSQLPTGPPSQNRYDALFARFAGRAGGAGP